MSLRRWFRRSTAWIALLAVCFGVLAPTLSQAALQLRGGEPGQWVQVCSASGISWVRAGHGDEAQPEADAPLSCPWGLMASGGAGLPPSHTLSLPGPAPHALPLAQAQRAAWPALSAHAPARAPPAGV